MKPSTSLLKGLLGAAFCLYFLMRLVNIPLHYPRYLWDFATYYKAAQLYASGSDPYAGKNYASLPLAMAVLYPVVWMSYHSAYFLFLGLKYLALGAVAVLWRKFLPRDTDTLFFFAFCVLAFNSTVYIDLASGNISLFEQLALWLGFWAYVQRRLGLFCICVIAAGAFKGTPSMFLLLLLDDRKNLPLLAGSLGLLAAVQALPYLVDPELVRSFFAHTSGLGRASAMGYNVGLRALLIDWSDALQDTTGTPISERLQWILFVLADIGIALISLRTWLRLLAARADREHLVCFACLVYAVVSPRFLNYSHLLLIVPAFALLGRLRPAVAALVFGLSVLPTQNSLLGIRNLPMWQHHLLLVFLGLWLLYVLEAEHKPFRSLFRTRPAPAPEN